MEGNDENENERIDDNYNERDKVEKMNKETDLRE